jgi:hypothetical protein
MRRRGQQAGCLGRCGKGKMSQLIEQAINSLADPDENSFKKVVLLQVCGTGGIGYLKIRCMTSQIFCNEKTKTR